MRGVPLKLPRSASGLRVNLLPPLLRSCPQGHCRCGFAFAGGSSRRIAPLFATALMRLRTYGAHKGLSFIEGLPPRTPPVGLMPPKVLYYTGSIPRVILPPGQKNPGAGSIWEGILMPYRSAKGYCREPGRVMRGPGLPVELHVAGAEGALEAPDVHVPCAGTGFEGLGGGNAGGLAGQ